MNENKPPTNESVANDATTENIVSDAHDTTPSDASDITHVSAEEYESLKKELAQERIAKQKAENAIALEKQKTSKIKAEMRSTKSEAEQLEEQRLEIEEEKRQLNLAKSESIAEKTLIPTCLTDDERNEVIGFITSEDISRTETAALSLKDILQDVETRLTKMIREKILKETPGLPQGESPYDNEDPFMVELRKQPSGYGYQGNKK